MGQTLQVRRETATVPAKGARRWIVGVAIVLAAAGAAGAILSIVDETTPVGPTVQTGGGITGETEALKRYHKDARGTAANPALEDRRIKENSSVSGDASEVSAPTKGGSSQSNEQSDAFKRMKADSLAR